MPISWIEIHRFSDMGSSQAFGHPILGSSAKNKVAAEPGKLACLQAVLASVEQHIPHAQASPPQHGDP
jgi:hypothetical protein